MPQVGVLATDAMQVRPGALGAPQERTVINRFTGARIRAVAFDLCEQRPDLLRVADAARFAYVDVATRQLHRAIRASGFGRHLQRFLEYARQDLHQPADRRHKQDAKDQQTGILFEFLMQSYATHHYFLNEVTSGG